MRFKSPSRSAHQGTYSPPTGRALTTARPESCRFGLFSTVYTPLSLHHFVTLHVYRQYLWQRAYAVDDLTTQRERSTLFTSNQSIQVSSPKTLAQGYRVY